MNKIEQHIETITVIVVTLSYIAASGVFGALLYSVGKAIVRAML